MNEKSSSDWSPTNAWTEKRASSEMSGESLYDPMYLPTYDEVEAARTKVLARAGGAAEWGWPRDNEGNPIYEFLNKEYLGALGGYLSQRAEAFGVIENDPLTILEVGAGNGRLAHFLQQGFEAQSPGIIRIVATDSGKSGMRTTFPVEMIDYKKALDKYSPKVVISSWMPYGVDFTSDFRATQSVKEYVLIGEVNGCCGDPEDTWGYIGDEFEREVLDDVSRFQICRTDNVEMGPSGLGHSQTVSFRRKE